MILTDNIAIRGERLGGEAESLREVEEVLVLDDDVPVTVIHLEVSVRNRHFGSPVIDVVLLDVPVNLHRAHIIRTVERRSGSCLTVVRESVFQRRKVFVISVPV